MTRSMPKTVTTGCDNYGDCRVHAAPQLRPSIARAALFDGPGPPLLRLGATTPASRSRRRGSSRSRGCSPPGSSPGGCAHARSARPRRCTGSRPRAARAPRTPSSPRAAAVWSFSRGAARAASTNRRPSDSRLLAAVTCGATLLPVSTRCHSRYADVTFVEIACNGPGIVSTTLFATASFAVALVEPGAQRCPTCPRPRGVSSATRCATSTRPRSRRRSRPRAGVG